MPVELSELLDDERWLEVEVAGIVLNVAYRPGATSLRRQAQIQKQIRQMQADGDEEEQVEKIGDIFCQMVSDWDLTDQGEPLPITPEVITSRLPGPVINAIMTAIGASAGQDAEEKKQLSATSDATSPRKGRREIAPNGTRSSERRNTWA